MWILPLKASQSDCAQRLTHRHSGLRLKKASRTAPRDSQDSSRTQQGNHAKRSENAPEPKSRTGTAKRRPHRVTHGHSEFSKGRNMRRTSTRKNVQYTPTTTYLRCQSSKVEAYKFEDATDPRAQRIRVLLPHPAHGHSGLAKEVTHARRTPP